MNYDFMGGLLFSIIGIDDCRRKLTDTAFLLYYGREIGIIISICNNEVDL